MRIKGDSKKKKKKKFLGAFCSTNFLMKISRDQLAASTCTTHYYRCPVKCNNFEVRGFFFAEEKTRQKNSFKGAARFVDYDFHDGGRVSNKICALANNYFSHKEPRR